MSTQKITPNLWCNGNAREMAEFYAAVFPGGAITGGSTYPSSSDEGLADFQQDLAGKDLTIDLTLAGYSFTLINAGPEFAPTPANSFMVYFDPRKPGQSKDDLTAMSEKLLDDGKALMPLQEYEWSEWYAWIEDKYGYSWQLILREPLDLDFPTIMPELMFGGPVQNRAAEASAHYQSVFQDSMQGLAQNYPAAMGPATTKSLMYSDFKIAGQWFAAMDPGAEQDFTFTEAVSYSVTCKDQAEIDYFWSKLSAHPASEQCGWCKDQFGVSWQIVPANMGELMSRPDAFKTMMQQKKIIIAEY